MTQYTNWEIEEVFVKSEITHYEPSDNKTYIIQVDVFIGGKFAYSKFSDMLDLYNARLHENSFAKQVKDDAINSLARMCNAD